jgi:hypothetical protein
MSEKDDLDCIKVMFKVVSSHEDNKHWALIERNQESLDTKTIMSICSFKKRKDSQMKN